MMSEQLVDMNYPITQTQSNTNTASIRKYAAIMNLSASSKNLDDKLIELQAKLIELPSVASSNED